MASVSLWEGGLPIEVLPVDGMLDVALGDEHFAWNPAGSPAVEAGQPGAASSD
jgi:hypothetical protein